MNGILKLADYGEELTTIVKDGLPQGWSTGFPTLDEYYKPRERYMSIVTGIPGHGKSEVIDAIVVNIARQYGAKFCVYSPENFPVSFHAIKLAEKYTGVKHSKLTSEGKREAHEWVDKHFTFLYPSEANSTIDGILSLAKEVQDKFGCQGLVIDPYNEVDHQRPAGLSETEYISQFLTKVRRFSRENKVHTWIVAHPAKLQKNKDGKYDPPGPYDISGSAHWRNKADFCLTVHRADFLNPQGLTDIHLGKVKFKHFGKVGMASLRYEYESGCYQDPAFSSRPF